MNLRRVFSIVVLAWSILPVSAGEILFVAETARGKGDGSDAANASSVAFFNAPASWGDGPGKISAGDTVRLVGTLSSVLTVQGSGSAGNEIQIVFEPGAKMSAPAWPNTTGAIYVNRRNYITIDGGVDGVIENTANGTGRANSRPSRGIQGINASFFTVKNLTIRNIYVRQRGNDSSDTDSSCISNKAAAADYLAHFTVQNCVLHDAYRGIEADFGTGCSAYEFANNRIFNINWGCGIGDRHAAATLKGVSFHHNVVYGWRNWDDTDSVRNLYHHNGFFAFGNAGVIEDIKVYANTFGPGYGNEAQTSGIYINTNVRDVNIYNNLFLCGPGEFAANGLITLQSSLPTTMGIFNNTFRAGSRAAIQLSGSRNGSLQTIEVKNNLGVANGAGTFIALYNGAGVDLRANNNIGFGFSPGLAYIYSLDSSGAFKTFDQWKALGFDTNGSNQDPALDSSNKPGPGSRAIGAGVDVSTLFNEDIARTSRTVPWDVGAYETSGPTPVKNLRIAQP